MSDLFGDHVVGFPTMRLNIHVVMHAPSGENVKSTVRMRTSLNEPPRGKTNNVVSDQVRHKPTCTSTEKSKKLEISDLSRRGTVLSE